MKIAPLIAFSVLVAAPACQKHGSAKTQNSDTALPGSPSRAQVPANRANGLPEPADDHYGVYLKGHKVGWMRSQVRVGAQVETSVQLRAQVGGLGSVAKIELDEKRAYDRVSGELASLSFEQRAATGSVNVRGSRAAGGLELQVTAGKTTTTQKATTTDTLADATAVIEMAAAAKVGQVRKVTRFDASILKAVQITHTVIAVEERLFGGVKTRAIRIDSDYPTLGIKESSWVDASGTVLESKVGGFFTARLEPPDTAKRLDYAQDLLISAVVKAPRSMAGSDQLDTIEMTFKGFGDTLPPESFRQRVSRKGDRVVLQLTRDRPPTSLKPKPTSKPSSDDPYLAATPFVQSGHEKLRSRAEALTANTTTLFDATSSLSRFVYEHVRDEYVPAYSNALEALETGRGDCTEHSILFVGLARAIGIPARVAVGIAYWPAGDGFGWHAWAEVRDGKRWYSVDPTWNQPIADVTHVKLADGGPAEQARIVMLLGRLTVDAVAID